MKAAWLNSTFLLASLFLMAGLAGCEPRSATQPTTVHSAPAPEAARVPGPDQDLFESDYIPRINVTVGTQQAASLEKDPRLYVQVSIRENDALWTNVAMRLKGTPQGSFRPLTNKPAFTLNFDKFKKGQRFHGLEKLYVNNSVEDDRYMTEQLCGQIFRDMGIPNPRAGHARVTINGVDRGLYVTKEGWDKTFLKKWFKDPSGDLYDSGLASDIDEPLDKNAGDKQAGQPALDRAVRVAREPDLDKRWRQLHEIVDMDQFLTFMALEVMMTHTDGYCMNRNNYRVYDNPETGRLVFMPHGMDLMFNSPDAPILPLMEGLMARAVVESPAGRQAYRERISELLTNVFRKEILIERVNHLEAIIRPAVEELGAEAALKHAHAVEGLRLGISKRLTVLNQLVDRTETDLISFDKDGVARLAAWRPQPDFTGDSALDVVDNGLHIRAGLSGATTASWRTNFLVAPGPYRFEARARAAQLIPKSDRKGNGAGIRASFGPEPRRNELVGNSPWTPLSCNFEIPNNDELADLELICELRAESGEVWFDIDSLRLVRLPKNP